MTPPKLVPSKLSHELWQRKKLISEAKQRADVLKEDYRRSNIPKLVPCDHPSCENGYITHTWSVCWPSEFSYGEPYETTEKCHKCNGEGIITEPELEDKNGD